MRDDVAQQALGAFAQSLLMLSYRSGDWSCVDSFLNGESECARACADVLIYLMGFDEIQTHSYGFNQLYTSWVVGQFEQECIELA